MGRVGFVRLEGGMVREVHDAAKGVAVVALGEVAADVHLEKAGDDALKGVDLLFGPLLLLLGGAGFPMEGKDVDEGWI